MTTTTETVWIGDDPTARVADHETHQSHGARQDGNPEITVAFPPGDAVPLDSPVERRAALKAFVTGSRAYGTPREDSDIDLVVMVSLRDMERLRDQHDERPARDDDDEGEYPDVPDQAQLRFGRLNLLCVTQEDDYEAWRSGTEELIARSPVTRAEAVEVFDRKRAEVQAAKDAANAVAMASIEAAVAEAF
jgi:predicted nucleotidyltransferase